MNYEEMIRIQESVEKLYEPQRKMIESLQKMVQVYDGATYFQTNDFMKNINGLNGLSDVMKIDTGIVSSLQNMVGNLNLYAPWKEFTNISSMFTDVYQAMSNNVDIIRNAIGFSDINNYSGLVAGLESFNEKFTCIIEQIYQETLEDDIKDKEEIEFISNEEFQEVIQEQIENPKGFQERVSNWTEAKRKKYFIAYIIMSFIWSNFIQPYFVEYVGMPVTSWIVSTVKEIPEKTSEVIGELKAGMEAIIIDNVPYYYKVTFVDENGEIKEGYVSKRSVKIIEETIAEEQEEETIAEEQEEETTVEEQSDKEKDNVEE